MADIGGKPKVLSYGKEIGNVSLCMHFGISRQTYYPGWKRDYEREGERALIKSKPCPKNPKMGVPSGTEELIVYLRTNYYLVNSGFHGN